jgi:hypothetical protein
MSLRIMAIPDDISFLSGQGFSQSQENRRGLAATLSPLTRGKTIEVEAPVHYRLRMKQGQGHVGKGRAGDVRHTAVIARGRLARTTADYVA